MWTLLWFDASATVGQRLPWSPMQGTAYTCIMALSCVALQPLSPPDRKCWAACGDPRLTILESPVAALMSAAVWQSRCRTALNLVSLTLGTPHGAAKSRVDWISSLKTCLLAGGLAPKKFSKRRHRLEICVERLTADWWPTQLKAICALPN